MIAQGIQLPVLHSREEIGVVAALAQLHDDVQNHRSTGVAPPRGAVHHVNVPQENVPVDFLLLG